MKNVLCEKDGQCRQSEISKLIGISRQTINSAIRKLEKEEIVYLEQGKEIFCKEYGRQPCDNTEAERKQAGFSAGDKITVKCRQGKR